MEPVEKALLLAAGGLLGTTGALLSQTVAWLTALVIFCAALAWLYFTPPTEDHNKRISQ